MVGMEPDERENAAEPPTRWKRIEEKCPKCGYGSRSNGSTVIPFTDGQAGLRIDYRICLNPATQHSFTIQYGVVPIRVD